MPLHLPSLDEGVVSYGGGVQSTALLVLAAEQRIPYRTFVFSNVGDDSEHPGTIRYVREIAFDYAAAHGLRIEEVERVMTRGPRKGPITLYKDLMSLGSRSIPIPVRMGDNGAPGTRQCTGNYKIRVVQQWLRANGATPARPARLAVGISTDEWTRANSRTAEAYEILEYPLLSIEHRYAPPRGGLDRSACAQIIRDAGLPVPPKSSCYFCPFHKPTVWADMARDEPELFEKAAGLEDVLNIRRSTLPCPGAGMWPLEARRQAEGEEGDEEARFDYEEPELELRGEGGCPKCRSRQAIERNPEGRLIMAAHARGPVFLTRFGKPLRSIFGAESAAGIQGSLLTPGWDADEGYRCGDVCDT